MNMNTNVNNKKETVAGIVRTFLHKIIRYSSVKKNELGLTSGGHYRLRGFKPNDTHFKEPVVSMHVVLSRNVENKTQKGSELQLEFYPYDEKEETEGYNTVTFAITRDSMNVINFDTEPSTEYDTNLVWTLATLRQN
jgi:hypothetical protein